jgi:DNA-binding NarL/FixJ family response regulator
MPETLPSIVLVDDHVVVRNGLAELIDIMGNFRVTGQYSNGQELLDALTGNDSTYPDVILMDLNMPVMNGEQCVNEMKNRGLDIPVLILSLNTDDQTILRLYRLGARGYLSKDCSASSLREAINDVLARGFHHSETLQKALMAGDPKPSKEVLAREEILKKLTPRELEFLKLVCHEAEYTYEEMARMIGVSKRTVDGYREAVFEKFGIKSKTGLVLFATRYQLM